eukprot:TRINITY_DN5121_c0_g1_i1.p1 TRINITY_DN5121_c0_g1~~TRINITY_DN5121_c0_g1_i1.p1  ORF type:complete len:173 (+),score=37.31 TRINITY_DN5121_c0_g1_i1:3-521(+)
MANFAAMMVLETYFPSVDETILEMALELNGDDVDKTRMYLQKKGYELDSAAAAALTPRKNEATEESLHKSAGMLQLQKRFPDMEVMVLEATLRAFDDDVNQASNYLEQHGHVMHAEKMVRTKKENPPKEGTILSSPRGQTQEVVVQHVNQKDQETDEQRKLREQQELEDALL